MKQKTYSLSIGWLYPKLMNTYGDRGNIIIFQRRCEWRGIQVEIHEINPGASVQQIESCDFLFMGGAQDTQQEIVERELRGATGNMICKMIDRGTPTLLVCGGYQFLGKYYVTAQGKKISGLGLLPLYTTNPGTGAKRLVGNIVVRPTLPDFPRDAFVVGFENHGGRTHLERGGEAFATVVQGFGNNGEDKTEGIHYMNAIGTYLHGPILAKSPELSDYIISKALFEKYKKIIELPKVDDKYSIAARNRLVKRLY